MSLVLDEVTVEVSDLSDGLSLQLGALIQSIGGPGALGGKVNADFSNTTANTRAALFALMKADGLFAGLSGVELG